MTGESPLRTVEPGLAYRIRRSSRARRVRVTVHASGEVEVVLPRGASERSAAAAVRELAPWIERRLREARRTQALISEREDTVPYLGSTLRLVEEPGRRRVHRRDDVLLVPAGPERIEALERWYRRAAQAEIAPRLERACAAAGRTYTRLSIREQRTRWASCSRSGTMSFNWRLLLAPEPVLEYVIWHEVCHLERMDHSPRFWALVEAGCPDYREHVRWLKRHGSTLRLA